MKKRGEETGAGLVKSEGEREEAKRKERRKRSGDGSLDTFFKRSKR